MDARDVAGAAFCEERLVALLGEADDTAETIVSRIEQAVEGHVSGAAQFDDVTVLALRRTPGALTSEEGIQTR